MLSIALLALRRKPHSIEWVCPIYSAHTQLGRRPVTRSSKQAGAKELKQEVDCYFGAQLVSEDNQSGYKSTYEQEEHGSSASQHGGNRRVRGPYRKYDEATKKAAITMARMQGNDYASVSKKLKIPAKNIKRWIASGAVRKKGSCLSYRRQKDSRPHDGVKTQQLDSRLYLHLQKDALFKRD